MSSSAAISERVRRSVSTSLPGRGGQYRDHAFTALSFAEGGVLIAAGTTYASLWRIDLRTASASKIASYPLSTPACDPAVLLNARRERGGRMVAVLPAAARQ